MSGLLEMLRHNEAQTFLRNAEFVRSLPDSPEKLDAARRQIHWAMYRAALRQITEDERQRILSILAPCCPGLLVSDLPAPFPFPSDPTG